MRCIVLPTRPRRRPRCVEGCCAFKRRSAKRLRAQAIDGQGNITRISQSSYVYDALGRRLKKAVKDETGKERITYYGWDGDRLVHTERMKDDGTRDIVHTVYEPGTFTPLIRLSTHAKGDPQTKPHLMVQAAKAVVPEQQQDDASTTVALQGLQGAMSDMPEAMRKMLEQGMKQALQGGLSPMAKSIMGGMGIDPDALIQSMNKGIEEERQKEQTPIDILFYHCDHLGTPIALTDQKGQIAWAAKHDPWGKQEGEFNPHGIEQDIRLPGQHHDKETGLYYNYRRYYDPAIGSYVNQDPIGLMGGMNGYGYVSGDPVNFVDPEGLATYMCTQPLHALGAAGRFVYSPSSNPLYHQFIGIIRPDGSVITGGQDRAGGPWSKGKPSKGDGTPESGAECKKVENDNECLEQCLMNEFAAPRPKYSLALQRLTGGQNCQGWADSTLAKCKASCKAK